tara:strand:- start:166 stop:696 length:531 start_codon:yes stop_codon:yes gene_type:complete
MVAIRRSRKQKLDKIEKYGSLLIDIFNKLPRVKNQPWNIRRDSVGIFIDYYMFGITKPRGWHVDHLLPQSYFPHMRLTEKNLVALNWKSNIAKSNKIDWLNKKIHYSVLKENKIHRNIRRSLIKLYEGKTYMVYLNAKEKISRPSKILEINKKYILVKIDNKKYKVYPDRVLFREL